MKAKVLSTKEIIDIEEVYDCWGGIRGFKTSEPENGRYIYFETSEIMVLPESKPQKNKRTMKAKIKATGEILNIAEYATIMMDQTDRWGNPIEYKPEEVELIDDGEDLSESNVCESRRFELMKAVLPVLIQELPLVHDRTEESFMEMVADLAAKYADAAISRLKEK